MCGVFGFISADGKGPDLALLRAIGRETETRGQHAHGLAWVDPAGRLHAYKRSDRLSWNLECLDRLDGARMVIGHCRYATSGRGEGDNHPHPADGGWIVHNGIVFNHRELVRRFDLAPSTKCDSEVLGLLIGRGNGSLLERAAAAVAPAEGPLVVMGLWTRPLRLLVVRRGKPLHVAVDGNRNVYFASLPGALEASRRLSTADRLLDNTARVVRVVNGDLEQRIAEVEPCRKRKAEANPPLGRPLKSSSRAGSGRFATSVSCSR